MNKDFQAIYNELIKYRRRNKYIRNVSPLIVMCQSSSTKALEENDIPLDRSICRYYHKLTTDLDDIKSSVNIIDGKNIAQWKKALAEENKDYEIPQTTEEEKSNALIKNPLARFMVRDTYQLDDQITAKNIEKLVKNVQSKKQHKYYSSKLPLFAKHSIKVTTDDFESLVLEKPGCSLLLYYNKATAAGRTALKKYEDVMGKHSCNGVNFYRMTTYSEV